MMTARTTAAALHTAEITETVGERKDHIASEGVVTDLLMVVACISHGKVLRLSENVVRLEGQSELVLEKKLRDLGIDNELILLWSGIAVVPVIIEYSSER